MVIGLVQRITVIDIRCPRYNVAVLWALNSGACHARVGRLVRNRILFLRFTPSTMSIFQAAVRFDFGTFDFRLDTRVTSGLFSVIFTIRATFVRRFYSTFMFNQIRVARTMVFRLPFRLPGPGAIHRQHMSVNTLFYHRCTFVFQHVFCFTRVDGALHRFSSRTTGVVSRHRWRPTGIVSLFKKGEVDIHHFRLTSHHRVARTIGGIGSQLASTLARRVFTSCINVDRERRRHHPRHIGIRAWYQRSLRRLGAAPRWRANVQVPLHLLRAVHPNFNWTLAQLLTNGARAYSPFFQVGFADLVSVYASCHGRYPLL